MGNVRTPIVVPDFSRTADAEIKLSHWEKRVGQRVVKGDPLTSFDTDKANFDLVAPATGVLVEVANAYGDVLTVGQVIGWIDAAIEPWVSDPLPNHPTAVDRCAHARRCCCRTNFAAETAPRWPDPTRPVRSVDGLREPSTLSSAFVSSFDVCSSQHMSYLDRVFLWLGRSDLATPEFERYFEIDDSVDLDDPSYRICGFCRDIGERWYDEDFIGYLKFDPPLSVEGVLDQVPISLEARPAILARCQELGLEGVNATYWYSGEITTPSPRTLYNGLHFIGEFDLD